MLENISVTMGAVIVASLAVPVMYDIATAACRKANAYAYRIKMRNKFK